MAMSSIMSYLGGFICWMSPSFTVRVCERQREQLTTRAWFPEAFWGTVTYPPIFGFNDDFVTFELLDFDLDVGFFIVGDPGSFLA